MKENDVDFNRTKFYLGAALTVDPQTELVGQRGRQPAVHRDYRKGYELPDATRGWPLPESGPLLPADGKTAGRRYWSDVCWRSPGPEAPLVIRDRVSARCGGSTN
ncbi:MAG: hypothetical protein U0736_03525 [Gemmataceae bacterium]